jgi:hypothetical protein
MFAADVALYVRYGELKKSSACPAPTGKENVSLAGEEVITARQRERDAWTDVLKL